MTLSSNRGLGNRLLRRVRRHASITTMFRPADPSYSGETTWGQRASTPAGTSVNMPADYQRDGNLVQASILSEPLQPTDSFQLDRLIVPTRLPRDFINPIQSSGYPVDVTSSTTQERYPANTEVAAHLDDDETLNNDWQQLQTIYRLHQEKNLETKESPNPPNNIQGQGESSKKTGGQNKGPQITPASVSESNEATLSVNLETHREGEPRSMVDSSAVSPEVDTEALSSSEPDIDEMGSTPENPKIHSHVTKTTNESLSANTPSVTHDQEIDLHDSEQEPPTDLNAEPPFSDQDETMAPAVPVQSLPLQAVWPVQRQPVESDVDNPTAGADTIQTVPLPDSSLQTASNDIRQGGIDTIQNTLSQVIPNQPTKSSIELIPPKRPRPDIQHLLAELRDETPSDLEDESSDLPPEEVRKQQKVTRISKFSPQESQKQGDGKTIIEADPMDNRTPLGLRSTQKEASKSLSDTKTETQTQKVEDHDGIHQDQHQFEPKKPKGIRDKNESEFIQTGIGPLPADLWHILEKDPPLSIDVEEGTPNPRDGSPEHPAGITRRSTVDIDNPPKTPKTSIPEPSPTIQRSVTSDEVQTPTSTTSTSESSSVTRTDETSSQSTEPDIGELSRRVYSEIRHKLMVEWERSRIRK